MPQLQLNSRVCVCVCVYDRERERERENECFPITVSPAPALSTANKNDYLKHIWSCELKIHVEPWLVWLSALNIGLQTERSLVRFPVRAHAWVAGQAPTWGHVRGN